MKDTKPFNRELLTRTMLTRGFTLVELLIVIAIIAALSSVLFPTLLFVRENGRRSACLSNERQLGLALLQYTLDHDDNWPSGTPIVTSAGFIINRQGAGWAGQCYPYVRNTEVFRCPDDVAALPPSPLKDEDAVSYGYNSNIATFSSTRHLAYLAAPAKTVLLFEVSHSAAALTSPVVETSSASGNGGHCGGWPPSDTFPCWEGSDVAFPLYAKGNMGGRLLNGAEGSTPRHRGGADYLACDGHVEWFRPSEVSSGRAGAHTGEQRGAPQTDLGAAGTANPGYKLTFSLN